MDQLQSHDNGLHNEHVYKYWRWKAWICKQLGRTFGRELCEKWAEEEHD